MAELEEGLRAHVRVGLPPAVPDPVGLRRLVVVGDRKLADVPRDRDGQPALGLVVAEEDVGHRLASPLAGQPRLDDRPDVLGGPAGRERPPVHQHEDGRGAGRVNGLQQLLLPARQVEARHVEALAVRAGLPRSVPLVLAEDDDRDLRLPRRLRGGCDLVGRIPDDVAPLHESHVRPGRDLRPHALEHRHHVLEDHLGRVVAELVAGVVGVRPDHGDLARSLRRGRRSRSFLSRTMPSRAARSASSRCSGA